MSLRREHCEQTYLKKLIIDEQYFFCCINLVWNHVNNNTYITNRLAIYLPIGLGLVKITG